MAGTDANGGGGSSGGRGQGQRQRWLVRRRGGLCTIQVCGDHNAHRIGLAGLCMYKVLCTCPSLCKIRGPIIPGPTHTLAAPLLLFVLVAGRWATRILIPGYNGQRKWNCAWLGTPSVRIPEDLWLQACFPSQPSLVFLLPSLDRRLRGRWAWQGCWVGHSFLAVKAM